MFERFTERARQVVVMAQEGARLANSGSIEPIHILYGISREEEGSGARTLDKLGITIGLIETWIPARGRDSDGQLPFTPNAKKAMELALREALSLGHNYIGTEHLLLGLIRTDDEPSSVAVSEFFDSLNITQDQIRDEVIRFLQSGSRKVAVQPSKPVLPPDPLHVAADHALACAGALLNWMDAKLVEWKAGSS